MFEKCLTANEVYFSDYNCSVSKSTTSQQMSPLQARDSAYSARMTANSPTAIIDSGTSSHIHSHRADFLNLKSSSSGSISGFGAGKSSIAGRGEAQLLAKLPKGGCARLKLQRACFVPNSSPTLISVSRLDEADCYTIFGDGRCVTFDNDDNGKLIKLALSKPTVTLTGTLGSDRLYHMDTPKSSQREYSFTVTRTPILKLERLHRVFGHLNYQSLASMIRNGTVCGADITRKELRQSPPPCDSCLKGKATRASFPTSQSEHAKTILGLVHSDLWGPAPVSTINGMKYIITFTDDKSRWLWVSYLKRKSDAFTAFKQWLAYVEKETGQKLRTYRTDNGGEFILKEWADFLKERGIRHQTSAPYTPEQNGDAERQNRSIFDRVRTILIESGLPLFLWAEAVNYITYTKNRHSTHALHKTTPFEVRYKKKPNVMNLRPFGCKAYVYDTSPTRKKLSP